MLLFIRCVIEDDHSAIVISGTPPEEAVQSAWLSLYSEYTALIGGSQISTFIRQIRQINSLHSKIIRVQSLLDCLRLSFSLDIVQSLKDSGYSITGDSVDDPALIRSLNMVDARLNTDKLKLKQLQNELPEPKHDEKPKEEDFYLTVMECSKLEGGGLKVKDLSTYEYCLHVQRLRKHIESLTKANQHGRN